MVATAFFNFPFSCEICGWYTEPFRKLVLLRHDVCRGPKHLYDLYFKIVDIFLLNNTVTVLTRPFQNILACMKVGKENLFVAA